MNKKIKEQELKIKQLEAEIDALHADIEKAEQAKKDAEAELEELCEKDRQKWYDVILDALVIGADGFVVRHGMTAPYSYGFYVMNNQLKEQSKMFNEYCREVDCTCNWMKELPKKLYQYLVSHGWTEKEFRKLKADTQKAWNEFPKAYDPDVYKPDRDYWKNHVANGYETDGFWHIVRGDCTGTYSTYTTGTQNDLAKQLIVMKGFCPDIYRFDDYVLTKHELSQFYKRHGIDSDLSDMNAWAERNPTRCAANKTCYQRKDD